MTDEVRITSASGGQKGAKLETWSLVAPEYRLQWVHGMCASAGMEAEKSAGAQVLLHCLAFELGGSDQDALDAMLAAAQMADGADARELANLYGYGCRKYARGNWRKGYEYSLSIDALWRHSVAYLFDGQRLDPEHGLHHSTAVLWHVYALRDFVRLGVGVDDRLWMATVATTFPVPPVPADWEPGQ